MKPYSIAALALLLAVIPARAGDTILYTFTGSSDGSYPYGSLTLSGSTLYGMTSGGSLFSMNTNGTGFAPLHSFNFFPIGTDGTYPAGSLTLSGSTLYGMTYSGGSSATTTNRGKGTIFSINTNGTGYGLLRNFTGASGDGGNPNGSLTLSGSTLYGMTAAGGSSGNGTIFSMNTNGTGFNLLHSFAGGADGSSPRGSLTLSGSTLYGMTYLGGNGGSGNIGTIFSMNTNGTGYSLLHSFTSGTDSDGANPYGSLTLVGSTLYGMTQTGGTGIGGTIFRINTNGTSYSVLHNFVVTTGDGEYPFGSLTVVGSKLYGMTQNGGSGGFGTIFNMNTDGTGYQMLQSFLSGPTDGSHPRGDLTLSADA